MSTLGELIATGQSIIERRVPPRVVIDTTTWIRAGRALRDEQLVLLGLWGDRGAVHLALLEEATRQVAIMSLNCPDNCFPSVGQFHTPAIRLERTIRDLYSIEATDAPDKRPWLDHSEYRRPT